MPDRLMTALRGFLSSSEGGRFLLVVGTLLAASLALMPVLHELFALWSDTDRPYSHGILVGPVACCLALRASVRSVVDGASSGSWLALALLIGLSIVWLLGFYADVLIIQEMLFGPIVISAVAVVAGMNTARRLLFPISFVYFAVPIWDYAIPPLRILTISTVEFVLELGRVPLFIEGNVITIPEGAFEIANGCAGLHYFIVAMTISSFYSYLYLPGKIARIGFIALAGSLAIATNWVRVASLILIGRFTDMQHYLIANEHYYYGWILYAVVLVLTFALAPALFTRHPKNLRADADSERKAAMGIRASPKLPTAKIVALIFALSLLVAASWRGEPDLPGPPIDVRLPEGGDAWTAATMESAVWSPLFRGVDGQALGRYSSTSGDVDAFMAVYRSQAQGRELIGEENEWFGSEFRPVSAARIDISRMGSLKRIEELVVDSADGRSRVIWYWYIIGQRPVVGKLSAKLWQALSKFSGSDSGAAIAVSTSCSENCARARIRLASFVAHMGDTLSGVAASLQASH